MNDSPPSVTTVSAALSAYQPFRLPDPKSSLIHNGLIDGSKLGLEDGFSEVEGVSVGFEERDRGFDGAADSEGLPDGRAEVDGFSDGTADTDGFPDGSNNADGPSEGVVDGTSDGCALLFDNRKRSDNDKCSLHNHACLNLTVGEDVSGELGRLVGFLEGYCVGERC